MSDDEILERGGTQEDINRYAHDVGGACGAAYGDTCDDCVPNKASEDTLTYGVDLGIPEAEL